MMDDAFEDDEVDAEADDVTNSVLEEIGIDMASKVLNIFFFQHIKHHGIIIYYFFCRWLPHHPNSQWQEVLEWVQHQQRQRQSPLRTLRLRLCLLASLK